MWSVSRRGVALAALCTLLLALLVGYGTVTPDPSAGRFPGNDEIGAGTVDAGDRVVVSGTVRDETSGGTVVDLDDGPRVVVHDLDAAPAPGDPVWLYGTYHDGTIRTRRAIVRAPWEITYLYAVSLLGGLVTFTRVAWTWRLDTDGWHVVPREDDRG
jgi:hypothetical protein